MAERKPWAHLLYREPQRTYPLLRSFREADTDRKANTDRLEEDLREQQEDATEDFLYELYDHVSPKLAVEFRRLIEQADKEVAILAEVGRSLGLEVDEAKLRAPDPVVDRITWEPVARSSVLALFDWLVEHAERDEEKTLLAGEWSKCCTKTVDFEEFQAETALVEPDARIAVGITAQAVVSWDLLQNPISLLYRGRYLTFYASSGAGSIRWMETEQQPIVFVPGTSDDLEYIEEGSEIHVKCSRKTIELCPVAPISQYSRVGKTLVVSGSLNTDPTASIHADVRMTPANPWSYVVSEGCVRLSADDDVSFSMPRTMRVHRLRDGLLLERNVAEDVTHRRGVEGPPAAVPVAELGATDTEVLARFVHEKAVEGE